MYRKLLITFLLLIGASFIFSFINNSLEAKENIEQIDKKAFWINSENILIPEIKVSELKLVYYKKDKSIEKIKLNSNNIFLENSKDFNKFPYLKNYNIYDLPKLNNEKMSEIIKGNPYLELSDKKIGIQKFGIIDEIFSYENYDLGISFLNRDIPVFKIWSPVSLNIELEIYDNSEDKNPKETVKLQEINNIWSVKGKKKWLNKFYLYKITLLENGNYIFNRVTDPYSISLSTNSKKSQVINLKADNLKPKNWDKLIKPELENFTDMSIYELHVRDFSIQDKTVPELYRGKYKAFTINNSNGMKHLKSLSDSGLTHIHLLPVFDIATINENEKKQLTPVIPEISNPADKKPQEIIGKIRDKDPFNWGYDPFHYNVPEGSYSTDPNGSKRIIEFREMIKNLSDKKLRVIMDVVFNHTHSTGKDEKSVLDKIVPDYYYRLDLNGKTQNTTCCPDTATERKMMENLMISSLKSWAINYKVDGFRFDLMGHHTIDNMKKIREVLNSLNLEKDGIDGKKIYLYGEGWKFGSLDQIFPKKAMNQNNSYGLEIGTFNDRIRDSLRGGNFSHSTKSDQGFINGLYYDPNNSIFNTDTPSNPILQRKQLINYMENIKLGLAGNLKEYSLKTEEGNKLGYEISYRGNIGAGYTKYPHENINYVSAHDNYTLWDQITAKVPNNTSVEDKVKMQKMALSIVALGQGIPFFHAGSEILRSKSGDGDSYDSGDYFNSLDFTYQNNGWGKGLPPEWRNSSEWSFWEELLLKNPKPDKKDILNCLEHFKKMLLLRKSSPLFRLTNKEEIQKRVFFPLNYDNQEIPGLITMYIKDGDYENNIDKERKSIIVFFNALNKDTEFINEEFKDKNFKLNIYSEKAIYDSKKGIFKLPQRSVIIFEELE